MKPLLIVLGVIVLAGGIVLLIVHSGVAGGVLMGIGLLALIGALVMPAASPRGARVSRNQEPGMGLDAQLRGDEPLLDNPLVGVPNTADVARGPALTNEPHQPGEPASGPPHPPESY